MYVLRVHYVSGDFVQFAFRYRYEACDCASALVRCPFVVQFSIKEAGKDEDFSKLIIGNRD